MHLQEASRLKKQHDSREATPFLVAVTRGSPDVVTSLCRRGSCNPNETFGQFETPAVMKALVMGNFEVVRVLVELGADINAHNRLGKTAAHLACNSRDPAPLLQLLHSCHADFNVQDTMGRTPLLDAASAGNHACMRQLVALGASATIQDKHGNTLLQCAQDSQDPVCLRVAEELCSLSPS